MLASRVLRRAMVYHPVTWY